jgi:hypothetical protein
MTTSVIIFGILPYAYAAARSTHLEPGMKARQNAAKGWHARNKAMISTTIVVTRMPISIELNFRRVVRAKIRR